MNKGTKIKTIEITAHEGRIGEDYSGAYYSVAQFDAVLARIAKADGYILKTNFRITWEDGETYEGRIDVPGKDNEKTAYTSTGELSILDHVEDYLTFHNGTRKPETMSAEDYDHIRRVHKIDVDLMNRLLAKFGLA